MKMQILESGREARLLEDITVDTSAGLILIPAGFETDFASVPQLFWSIVPPWGKYSQAAIVHDCFYRTPSVGDGRVTRKEADRIFLEEMKEAGVPGGNNPCA